MTTRIHRVEVRYRPAIHDPRAQSLRQRAQALGYPVSAVNAAKVYLLEADMEPAHLSGVLESLLTDPVTEVATIGAATPSDAAHIIEVHPLPGVMDPAAQSVRDAVKHLTGIGAGVSTGLRLDITGVSPDDAEVITRRLVANPVVHQITRGTWRPEALPKGHEYTMRLRTVALRGLSDAALQKLSREAHLFLSLDEMRAIRDEFEELGREPTDIELETLAQTWSEHCVHKTLKSRITYRGAPLMPEPPRPAPSRPKVDFKIKIETGSPRADRDDDAATTESALPAGPAWEGRPGHTVNEDGSVFIDNLLKSTVAAATFELINEGVDWTLSVFKDNSGVIEFNDDFGVCIKVETHNHPSALEPYGGSATGAGGCIRDVIGTGLGAKPIANTDVFCVAFPTRTGEAGGGKPLPPGTLDPRRILTDVVSGVRDYGNRMGIPTVNGAVSFDDRYVGNPLVFCGCIGLIPRHLVSGAARAGDRIIALGGRTGRDGIHGATFSSAELEATHADEFSHAVQIGNAIEEKRVLDAILRARDEEGGPLYTAMTDCGAGGFSSAVGEMGKDLGAEMHLERAPLKYAGLSYTEVWISEAQERMVLAVPAEKMARLQAICDEEHVELADLGTFGTPGADLILQFHGTEVGRLPMEFLHDGIPTPTRDAAWEPTTGPRRPSTFRTVSDSLLGLLGHPEIASKHWIIRQYDHEVQGNTVVKPLVGPGGRGPGDASVIHPVATDHTGIAIACGLQTGIGDPALPRGGGDPYLMALAAIDECIRNLVCVGADPTRTAILDNFCWPSCEKPQNLGSLVRAAEGCYDGAKAYRTPFVSGKDSLNNQLRYEDPATGEKHVIEIPPTLLITGLAQVRNVARCITMDAKAPGNALLLIGRTGPELGGSRFEQLFGTHGDDEGVPRVDLKLGPASARAVAQLITDGLVVSAHDCSDGGLLVAVAEMLIATTGARKGGEAPAGFNAEASMLSRLLAAPPEEPALGAELTLADDLLDAPQSAFAETPSRYVLEVKAADMNRIRDVLRDFGGVPWRHIGNLNTSGRLLWKHADVDVPVSDLARAWLAPLDW
jgi:phosphoribosylformylglycinamidine synthase II